MLDRIKWIDALESGEYLQGQGYLKTQYDNQRKPRFCCLGLGLELTGEPQKHSHGVFAFGPRQRTDAMPNDRQCRDLGISKSLANALAQLNDNGCSFKKIGAFLRTGDPEPVLKYSGDDRRYISALRAYRPPNA